MAETNLLIHETSPYLLQHAHNPVNWYPWGKEAFAEARENNKLVLVSVGYSACHWCHVMAHESFENLQVAGLMNQHFVCIKVDREEHPEVDQYYMTAVQLMTQRGGWPLNCFALPDGSPVYGGTYFPEKQWMDLLSQLATGYRDNPEKFREYAAKLKQGILQSSVIQTNSTEPSIEIVQEMISRWKTQLDNVYGGPARSPKFPMPANYHFLMRYSVMEEDQSLEEHVRLTLNKMAFGGIYDQLGGGFARYSTDSFWKVPHFEKMLYDNAQLMALYSEAFLHFRDPIYQEVTEGIDKWITEKMTGAEGGLYSAMDADSDGEEGAYYTWTAEELSKITGHLFPIIEYYYQIEPNEKWENKYILQRSGLPSDAALHFKIQEAEFRRKLLIAQQQLLAAREKRNPPGTDIKQLTSWNALAISGYVKAFRAFQNPHYLEKAQAIADFIQDHLLERTPTSLSLLRSFPKNQNPIPGFLDDYAFTALSFIELYAHTAKTSLLTKARDLALYVLQHFTIPDSLYFNLSKEESDSPILALPEMYDNVIPSANSAMAKVLRILGIVFEEISWINRSQEMIQGVASQFKDYPQGFGNWADLMLDETDNSHQCVVTGPQALEVTKHISAHYLPGVVFLPAVNSTGIPIFANRMEELKTAIYICRAGACELPVYNTDEALQILQK